MLAYICAGSDPCDEEAFTHKSVVGDGDRHARDSQRSCKVATRRQAIAASKMTICNGPTHLAVDFSAQVLTANQADVELHLQQCSL